MLRRLSKHSATVKSVINYFANSGSIRIYVHSVAGAQMSDDALGRNTHSHARQLRIPTRLNVINSKKPLIQRQMFTKSHDLFHSLHKAQSQQSLRLWVFLFHSIDALLKTWDAVWLQLPHSCTPEPRVPHSEAQNCLQQNLRFYIKADRN